MKRKLISFLIAAAMVLSLMPAMAFADYYTGSGTEDDPWIVDQPLFCVKAYITGGTLHIESGNSNPQALGYTSWGGMGKTEMP